MRIRNILLSYNSHRKYINSNHYNWKVLLGAFSIVPLLLLLWLHTFLDYPISTICQKFEFLLDIINVILAYIIYKKIKPSGNKLIYYFILSIFFLLLLDISYFIVYSSPHLYSYVMIYNLIHILYYFFSLMFVINVFLLSVVQKRQIIFIIFLFCIIDLSIFTYFSIYSHYYVLGDFTAQHLIRITQSFLEIFVFNGAMLWLIYSKNIESSILAAGYVIISAAEFMITSCYISTIMHLLDYGEILWAGGGVFLMLGMLMTINKQNYSISNWVRTNMSIRSKLTFWAFAIAFVSLIIFFIIVNHFATINPQFFVYFPTIIISYSLIVVFFSILIGSAFELPFIQIQNNIENMLINNEVGQLENFSIDEFIYLQKHLITTIAIKEEKDKIKKQFGDFAAEIAHDIESPLKTLEVVVSNLKNGNIHNDNIERIETSMQTIKDIAKNLLSHYRSLNRTGQNLENLHKIDDNNSPRYIILSSFIKQIIDSKNIEWKHNACNITLDIEETANLRWVFISPTQISRSISNILNNSYDSLDKKNRNIKLCLSVIENSFVITIEDNGSGIPNDEISQVLSGKSLKHIGNGIGLPSVITFLKTIDGNLKLSSKIAIGTIVEIRFPIKEVPSIFCNRIHIATNNVAVLDDDPNTILFWQNKFCMMNLKVMYFVSANLFIQWVKNNQNLMLDTTFLIDYDFSEYFKSGLEIINEFNLQTVYLISRYAEKLCFQEYVKNLNIKLIPKSILDQYI